tara:strand:- start:875 stop:1456 length:582 start_codon:yes stop_codon:yes gene_type:complete
MSDDVPQIPMPEFSNPPVDNTPPPEGGFTRELTPEEERNVLINFMGTQYGEMHKMDKNIVGESSVLKRGKSDEVKQQITQLLQQPVQPAAPQPLPPQPEVPEVEPLQSNLSEPQPSKVAIQVPVNVPPDPPPNSDQMTFNFDVSEKELLLNSIQTLADKIDNLNKMVVRNYTKLEELSARKVVKKKSVETTKK